MKKKDTFQIIQDSLYFINLKNNCPQKDIWEELNLGMWKLFDVNAFFSNDFLLPNQKHQQKKLFPDFHQVEPGVIVDKESSEFKLDLYKPKYVEGNYDKMLSIADEFFRSLKAKKIGVHLSGGLDSSIIIGLLDTLNIPFTPIGLKTDTFEFRTERHIQEKLISLGNEGELISIDECPYFSKLLDNPMHQIPCGVFKSFASSLEMAKRFAQKGCDVVISGQGGDSLFVESFQSIKEAAFNIGDEFNNDEFSELVYIPNGIRLVSFYSYTPFIDLISTLRIGKPFDPLKKWARRWFKDILIPELSEYNYCADFLGINMKGLHEARNEIALLFEETYDLIQSPFFSPIQAKKFLDMDIFTFGYNEYIKYCSLLSIMVWLHSITNRNILN